jgi:hypothetical protein
VKLTVRLELARITTALFKAKFTLAEGIAARRRLRDQINFTETARLTWSSCQSSAARGDLTTDGV